MKFQKFMETFFTFSLPDMGTRNKISFNQIYL